MRCRKPAGFGTAHLGQASGRSFVSREVAPKIVEVHVGRGIWQTFAA